MLETLNIFSYVSGNPQIEKNKGHYSNLLHASKTRKCYIHITVGSIYKEKTPKLSSDLTYYGLHIWVQLAWAESSQRMLRMLSPVSRHRTVLAKVLQAQAHPQ